MRFFYLETQKVSTSNQGWGHVLLHKPCHKEADHLWFHTLIINVPWNGFENGFNIGENTVEWVLLAKENDENFFFFSANRAQPGSQKFTVKWVYRVKFVQVFLELGRSLFFLGSNLNNVVWRGLCVVWTSFYILTKFISFFSLSCFQERKNVC